MESTGWLACFSALVLLDNGVTRAGEGFVFNRIQYPRILSDARLMRVYPVSSAVNSVRNQGPECTEKAWKLRAVHHNAVCPSGVSSIKMKQPRNSPLAVHHAFFLAAHRFFWASLIRFRAAADKRLGPVRVRPLFTAPCNALIALFNRSRSASSCLRIASVFMHLLRGSFLQLTAISNDKVLGSS
jgi:hypothetical protein